MSRRARHPWVGSITALLAVPLAFGCAEEPAPAERTEVEAEVERETERPSEEEGEATRLHVPSRLIHRARREASGLSRMPESLRAQTLADRHEEATLSYADLRAEPDGHEERSVSFEGHVGLVRPAGPRLWILALQTRREGERWVDPLYVLSVIPPDLPPDGGASARVVGWVVGERTIGRNALPLILAYDVERTDGESAPGGAEDE